MVHEHNGPQNSAKRMRNLKAKSASDQVITNSLRHKATPGLDKNLLRKLRIPYADMPGARTFYHIEQRERKGHHNEQFASLRKGLEQVKSVPYYGPKQMRHPL